MRLAKSTPICSCPIVRTARAHSFDSGVGAAFGSRRRTYRGLVHGLELLEHVAMDQRGLAGVGVAHYDDLELLHRHRRRAFQSERRR